MKNTFRFYQGNHDRPKPIRFGGSYDCKNCGRTHPAGPCENFRGCPVWRGDKVAINLVETLRKAAETAIAPEPSPEPPYSFMGMDVLIADPNFAEHVAVREAVEALRPLFGLEQL